MQIKVNPHTIELIKDNIVNEGEYNINTCYFEFSEEYNGLSKKAVFTNGENTYSQIISNDECIIPYEVLENEGAIIIGVYGYEISGETLIKRYSPTPVQFYVEKGSYTIAEESEQPSPTIIEQLEAQIETNANNISTLQTTKADKSEIPTKTSELINDSNFAYESDIPDVSNFITKDVDNLTNYTKTSDLSEVALSGNYEDLSNTPDLSVYATNTALGNETTARENADIGLQGQIDAITSATDVKDIVGTYADLQNYDTQHLGNNDIIKVLQDSTHNDAMTYYRWLKNTSTWQYIGQEGPYYTKSEIDTTLQPYVQNTDYATFSTGGVIKINGDYATNIYNGALYSPTKTYQEYQNGNNSMFIGKGTLENVITGKDLTTKSYVDGLVGDIATTLDEIQGEVI